VAKGKPVVAGTEYIAALQKFQFTLHWVSKPVNIPGTRFLFRKQKTLQPERNNWLFTGFVEGPQGQKARAETAKRWTCIKSFSHPTPAPL